MADSEFPAFGNKMGNQVQFIDTEKFNAAVLQNIADAKDMLKALKVIK